MFENSISPDQQNSKPVLITWTTECLQCAEITLCDGLFLQTEDISAKMRQSDQEGNINHCPGNIPTQY